MRSLQGKRALVTGASRGIGVHIAESLAQEGASLVLAARNSEQLQAVTQDLQARYPDSQMEYICTDMAAPDSIAMLYTKATQDGRPIDVLVNNAGIYQYGIFEQIDFEDVNKMVQINLLGLMQLTHLVLKGMKSRGVGHVVNISSLAGLSGSAYAETYCATKHAVVGFTRALRVSLKQERSSVSASVICPGIVAETGIFNKLEVEEDVQAPALMGKSDPRRVAQAVVRSIVKDVPEVVVNPTAVRPGLAFACLFPRIMETLSLKLGLHGFLNPKSD